MLRLKQYIKVILLCGDPSTENGNLMVIQETFKEKRSSTHLKHNLKMNEFICDGHELDLCIRDCDNDHHGS